MSPAVQFYASSIAILFGINLIAIWGLDLQYGVTGIFNFAYIVFQSAGAYADGVFSLHPAAYYQASETYVGGFNLPFPIPLLAAAAAGALLAVPVGFIGIRRLRGDYQAMAMLVLSLIATAFADAQLNLLNGPTGIISSPSLSPAPAHLPSLSVAIPGLRRRRHALCLLDRALYRLIAVRPRAPGGARQ